MAVTERVCPISAPVTRYESVTAPRIASPSRYHCQVTASIGAVRPTALPLIVTAALTRLPTVGASLERVTDRSVPTGIVGRTDALRV